MAQTVEELAEILDNIKLEADRNAETFDKLLTSINNKLEFMSNDTESDDLIKVYLTELKKTLEERHALIVSEFNKIETSFKSIADEQTQLSKTKELKEMFDVFSNNMNSIARELYGQKELLAQYDERFAAFTADKTDKNEIISSVSGIRKDVEVINRSFETSISDINSNIQSIFKNLIVMDPTAQNDIVKRELENIYLSTNAILSQLHTVDQKNDELSQLLDKTATKENFEKAQEKLNIIIEKYDSLNERFNTLTEKNDLDEIISKSAQISDSLNLLPQREDLKYFAQKTDELSGQISSLPQKSDLEELNSKTVEKLYEKIDEISVRPELNSIIDQTNQLSDKFLPLAEKSDTDNILMKTLDISEKINEIPTQKDIANIANKTISLEEQIAALPQQDDLADVYKAVHEFSTILDTLRENLTSSNESTALIIKEQLDNLNSVLSAVVTENDFKGFRHDLAEFIQKIIDNSVSLNDNLNVNKEVLHKLITEIENLDIHKNITTIANALDGLRINVSDNVIELGGKIDNMSSKIDLLSTKELEEKINALGENLYDTSESVKNMNSEIFEKLSQDNEDLKNKIENTNFDENFENITSSINELKNTAVDNADKITGGIENITSKLENIHTDNLEEKLLNLKDNLAETSLDVKNIKNEIFEKFSTDDSEKFTSLNNNLDFLRETIVSSQASNETNLSEKLSALRDMIQNGISSGDEKLIQIQNNLDEFVNKIKTISEETEIKIGNSISEITDLKSEIENISKDFTDWNYGQETRDSKIVNMISSELGEIGVTITTMQDTIQAGVHQELSKNSELVEVQINNLIKFIENLQENLSSKTDESSIDLETPFKELKEKITAVRQEINLINTDITDILNAKTDAVINALTPLKESFETFTGLEENISAKINQSSEKQNNTLLNAVNEIKEYIDKTIEENISKINISEDITSSFDTLNAALDKKLSNHVSIDDIRNEILNSTDDLKNTLKEKITSDTEDLKTLMSIALNNDDVTWAIDSLKSDLEDKVTRIFNERNNYTEILDKTNEILNKQNNFDEILTKNDEILQNNTKISNLLDAIDQKIDILAMSDATDDFDTTDTIIEIKEIISSQKNLLEKSLDSDKTNAIKKQLEDLINKIDTIESTDLKDMRESIIATILNVFEQISFIEESEEIKDFVEEKTDEINQNLIEVKQQLKQITNNDDGYTYTLQDVESDIAKLRLVINELSSSSSREDIADISDNIHKIVTSVEDLQNSLTQEQISDLKNDFEKLSQDILSISSRTNKLILTSDESYNALNNGLNDFSNIVYKLEERINYLDNKEITERIEQKLDNVANVVTGSANSDKVMRQALIYMGEWIDTTSENLDNLSIQTDKINEIEHIIEKLQKTMPEQTDLLNNLTEKFEEQQERIDRLEMKLEKILSALDDIDDTKLTKKVDKIDKQLTKLSDTIEKLATYVDE